MADPVEFVVEDTSEIQEVEIVNILLPKIGTKAHDKADGDRVIVPKKDTTIVDTVSYEHLIEGVEYTVKGILMDKSTEEPLLIDGNTVEAERTFVAETADGEIELEFTFDASKLLPGTQIVVFEELYENIDGEFELVAWHKDINDGNQTVTVVPSIIEELPKMGDGSLVPYFVSLIAGLGVLFAEATRRFVRLTL